MNQIYNDDSYKEPLKHFKRTFKESVQYKIRIPYQLRRVQKRR